VVRAPNADLSRDPRWGARKSRTAEDPFLVGTLATAYTEDCRATTRRRWMTASLLKHFLANSNEDGRAGSSSNFDDRLFHEYYAVPFRMAIEQGHANAMMTAYNSWKQGADGRQPVLQQRGDEAVGIRRHYLAPTRARWAIWCARARPTRIMPRQPRPRSTRGSTSSWRTRPRPCRTR